LAFKTPAIWPFVEAPAFDQIISPFALENGTIGPKVDPKPIFLALFVLSCVLALIWPLLCSLAPLLVFKPVPFISFPVHMDIFPLSVGPISLPQSFVDLAFDMDKFTLACSPSVAPLSFVVSSIRPVYPPVPVSKPTEPLAFINRTGFISMRLILQLRVDDVLPSQDPHFLA
jgi:hypothetical protein